MLPHSSIYAVPQITLSSKTKQLLENFRLNPCLLKLPGKLAPDSTVNYFFLWKLVSGVKRQERQRIDCMKFSIHTLNELESKNNSWQRATVTHITKLFTCHSVAETHICSLEYGYRDFFFSKQCPQRTSP